MTSYEGFYPGTDYGFDSGNMKIDNPNSTSRFGITTDPRTANQLKEVSAKLNTGAKLIEVTGISPEILESIPNQHLEELNRLRKLAGAELTFHGPLIEPTGIGRDRWDETQRKDAENQIWGAVERANKMDPEGNIIVTLHSSNGLPEPTQRVIDETGEEITSNLFIIDERTGRIAPIPKPTRDYFSKEEEKLDVDKTLKDLNEKNWTQSLNHLNAAALEGRKAIREALELRETISHNEPNLSQNLVNLYLKAKDNPKEYQNEIDKIRKDVSPIAADLLQKGVDYLNHGENFVKNAYLELKELYNQAYETSKINDDKNNIEKLEEYRKEVAPIINKYEKDPSKLNEFSEEIYKGIMLLGSLKEAPETFRPLENFAINKASETFSNVAFKAFEKFKEKAPIISIENPPAGMGLSRAEELSKLIEKTRDKFVEKVMEKEGLSKSEARKQAEKLIGATWDVGHINMIRKHGYGEEKLLEQTEKMGKYIKHVHLSDNFGMEHTELPMGMGNVPIKKEMEIMEKYNKKLKKIIETGGPWYKDFQMSPLKKTFEAFGSPIYSSKLSPTWKETGMMGDYFSGHGTINPETHHAYFGAGFTTLPSELGGQMPGGKSRFSGTPME